jgi:hypothetical protein
MEAGKRGKGVIIMKTGCTVTDEHLTFMKSLDGKDGYTFKDGKTNYSAIAREFENKFGEPISSRMVKYHIDPFERTSVKFRRTIACPEGFEIPENPFNEYGSSVREWPFKEKKAYYIFAKKLAIELFEEKLEKDERIACRKDGVVDYSIRPKGVCSVARKVGLNNTTIFSWHTEWMHEKNEGFERK